MATKHTQPCTRCGGAGGWAGWPGFTCFRCGGSGIDPKLAIDYTPEERAKLDARNERARERKEFKKATQRSAVYERFPEAAQVVSEWRARVWPGVPSFIVDVVQKAEQGFMSEKQAAALVDAWGRYKDRTLAREAEKAALQPVVEADATIITGKIVKVWYDDEGHFPSWRMTVKVEAGNIYRGTIPVAVYHLIGMDDCLQSDRLVGLVIKFTAQLTAAKNDPTIGYFKRPRKVELVADQRLDEDHPCGQFTPVVDEKEKRQVHYRNLADGSSLPVYKCNRCRKEVAQVQSKKTGAIYYCDVFVTYSHDEDHQYHRAAPWSAHKCDPEAVERWNRFQADAARDRAEAKGQVLTA